MSVNGEAYRDVRSSSSDIHDTGATNITPLANARGSTQSEAGRMSSPNVRLPGETSSRPTTNTNRVRQVIKETRKTFTLPREDKEFLGIFLVTLLNFTNHRELVGAISQALGLRLVDVYFELVRLARRLSPSAQTYVRVVPSKKPSIRMPSNTTNRAQESPSADNQNDSDAANSIAPVDRPRVHLPPSPTAPPAEKTPSANDQNDSDAANSTASVNRPKVRLPPRITVRRAEKAPSTSDQSDFFAGSSTSTGAFKRGRMTGSIVAPDVSEDADGDVNMES